MRALRHTSRVSRTAVTAVAIAGALMVAACGSSDDEAATGEAAAGTSGMGVGIYADTLKLDLQDREPTIPQTGVRLAQSPYVDHSTEIVGIENGWYEDVGITIEPPPHGKVLTMEQMAPNLIAGQIDVGTMVPQIWAGTLDQSSENKIFTYRDVFLGHAFLAAPGKGYKSVNDFMEEGQDWDQALASALGQMRGKDVAESSVQDQKAFRSFALGLAGMSEDDYQPVVLKDSAIVQLARGGRTDFASPVSGPDIVSLIGQGWVPLVTERDIIDNEGPEAMAKVIVTTGLAAKESWLQENPETALRMAGVQYRILDTVEDDWESAAEIQVPFLNSIAGTDFTVEDADVLYNVIDSFYTFEEQKDFFGDEQSPLYWEVPVQHTIDLLKEDGVISGDHDAGDIVVAADTWSTLAALRERAEALVEEVEAGLEDAEGENADQATSYLGQAREQLEARNYLDAFRFANAAQLWMNG